jgi:hypothetical protein
MMFKQKNLIIPPAYTEFARTWVWLPIYASLLSGTEFGSVAHCALVCIGTQT